jgi:hypothetical protein
VADGRPDLAKVGDVVGKLLVGGFLGDGAHDEAAALVGRDHAGHARAQRFTIDLVADLLRDANVRVLRQIHQRAAGDADLRGKTRALGADWVLDDLHHQRLAFEQRLLDRDLLRGRRVLGVARVPDVGYVQEGRALQADVDEGRLHAGQHAHHLAEVDVADQTTRERALDVEFLDGGLLDDGHARFLRRDIDEDVFGHGGIPRERVSAPASGQVLRARSVS